MRDIRSPGSGGFTLIEVVVVMGIMGILYAIAMPVVSALRQEAGLVSAQREAVSALYRTRSDAIASNTSRRVVFTPPASIQVTNSGGTTTYYQGNLDASHAQISIASDSAVTVSYDARGLLSPPTTVTLTLQDPQAHSKTVTIYPTGKPVAN